MEALRAEFHEHGAVKVAQLLDPDALQTCRQLFEDAVFAPKEVLARSFYKSKGGGAKYYYNDASGHRGSLAQHRALHAAHPEIGEKVAAILGSKNVWYCDHEVWYKSGETTGGTPLHQDTGVLPARGMHMANLWITFEQFTPAQNALGVVRGSHLGPLYTSPGVGNEKAKAPGPKTVARALAAGAEPPKIYEKAVPIGVGLGADTLVPMTREEKEAMKSEFKAMEAVPQELADRAWSVDLAQGDVLLVHPHCIHGNAPLTENHQTRQTIVIRVFGDECVYTPVPGVKMPGVEKGAHFSEASQDYFKIFGPGTTAGGAAPGTAKL